MQYIIRDLILSHAANADADVNGAVVSGNILLQYKDSKYAEPVFAFTGCYLASAETEVLYKLKDQLGLMNYPYPRSLTFINYPFLKNFCLLKAIYFFISESYLPENYQTDKHGRLISRVVDEKYRPLLEIPIADILVHFILNELKIDAQKQKQVYYTCDYDILNIWDTITFRSKVSQLIKPLILLKYRRAFSEWKSFLSHLFNTRYNPYMNTEMFRVHQDGDNSDTLTKTTNIAFWHVYFNDNQHDYINLFDGKNIRNFIRSLEKEGVVFGIHPAYGTSDCPDKLKLQFDRFKQIFGFLPESCRYHYLKYSYPSDYHYLTDSGIRNDFSYCFTDSLLFRGGRCGPLLPWDIKQHRALSVNSFPLTIMDGTLSDYLHLNFEQAYENSVKKIGLSLKYGNYCTLLWHNRSMYEFGTWNNYQHKLFPRIVEFINDFLIVPADKNNT